MKEFAECRKCGRWDYLDIHHVFFGTANRAKSEKWGMTIDLCRDCHALYHADYMLRCELCREYQVIFEESHSRELFRQEFGRSYL